jgi:predicted enzyme related to lactoylglutathione lyase
LGDRPYGAGRRRAIRDRLENGVPNLEEALAKIEKLGGKTMMPPGQVLNGPRIALFLDPENHLIGLVQL